MRFLLVILLFAVGVGAGVALAVASGWVSSFGNKYKKELKVRRAQVSTAEQALMTIRTGTSGNPELAADIALVEINQKTNDYMENN